MKAIKKSQLNLIFFSAVILIAGCSSPPPAGVQKMGVDNTYKQINASILNSSQISSYSQQVLRRYDLSIIHKEDIIKCINKLHLIAEEEKRSDTRLALAELSFQAAKKKRRYKSKRGDITRKACYLSAAFYAYSYVLEMKDAKESVVFNREFRLGCDLYNRCLSAALSDKKASLKRAAGTTVLPVGSIDTEPGFFGLPRPIAEYNTYKPADSYIVRGLSTRIRKGGIGAPLIVTQKNPENLPIGTVSPATLFVRFEGGLESLKSGQCKALVDVLNPLSQQSVMIGDVSVPLEMDLTTPLAYTLERSDLWDLGSKMFRLGNQSYPADIYPEYAYEKGKIPVVLVHGTMSSFVWWCEMLNTLYSTPEISNNYQFWLYLYDTGKPLMFSTGELREAINNKIKEFDPKNSDPALRKMVLIGHSQGGLLCRMMTVDTGEIVVETLTGKGIDDLKIPDLDKDKIRQYTVKRPIPAVKRVVFMSTPHRGSFRAGSFSRKLAKWFIKIPKNVLETLSSLEDILDKDPTVEVMRQYSTSVDSMAPDNKVLHAVASLPTPEGIKAHSIIAIDGDEEPPEGDDGVVKYHSAHINGVESEFIVRSGHSSQLQPAAIEEVRRILLLHLKGSN